ncbi:MAG TPA: glycosyltransferase [Solirubrobacteraceae bacterium]|jgi:glycosyltransferase involved in cell wall biosynthesis|nr:glycosyltransferase [Solirubrobacteraceae bacterium]
MSPEPSAVVWVPGGESPTTLAAAAAAAGRADVVVLLPGVEMFGDWLPRLVAAAGSETTIASASSMLSRHRWAPSPLPAGSLEETAATVAGHSGCRRPRISEPVAGCVLLRRAALDVAGASDEPVSPAAALADFAERCTAIGLGHVLADDVLGDGEASVPDASEARDLDARFPHRPAARELDGRAESPIEHAVLVASRGLDRLSVTIDARSLGLARAGTQVHALELIAALGRTGRVAVRVLTPPDLDPLAARAFEAIDGLTQLPYESAAAGGAARTDVVHRPSQVFSASDLALLLPLGQRIVVTHQDLIAYRIPGYHDSVENWQRYRRVTRETLAAADRVVFFSEHALADALADDLVDPGWASVVPIGVDHHVLSTGGGVGQRPAGLPDDDRPFLLCLGADLPHKNRAFAIALADALRTGHGWRGRLVFAGPTPAGGAPATRGEAGEPVIGLGPVSEPEKTWLLGRAAAVVYPTLYEGFGLIPFEAAAAGTPCLFAGQTALAEMLPASAATLVAWDARASAAAVARLLETGPARTAHVEVVREAAGRYRWDETAAALIGIYERAVAAPPGELRRAPRERLFLEERLEETERLRQEEWRRDLAFREEIGSDGLGLVGPGGVIDRGDQRAVLALLSRRVVRRPLTAFARAAYRLARPGRR